MRQPREHLKTAIHFGEHERGQRDGPDLSAGIIRERFDIRTPVGSSSQPVLAELQRLRAGQMPDAFQSCSRSGGAARAHPDARLWPERSHRQRRARPLRVNPPDQAIALQHREDVIAVAPLRLGHEDLYAVASRWSPTELRLQ